MMLLVVVIAALCVAYANGANDNFKGVATLFGSNTTNYRRALIWATATTLLGSLTALVLAGTLIKAFSGKGLIDNAIVADTRVRGRIQYLANRHRDCNRWLGQCALSRCDHEQKDHAHESRAGLYGECDHWLNRDRCRPDGVARVDNPRQLWIAVRYRHRDWRSTSEDDCHDFVGLDDHAAAGRRAGCTQLCGPARYLSLLSSSFADFRRLRSREVNGPSFCWLHSAMQPCMLLESVVWQAASSERTGFGGKPNRGDFKRGVCGHPRLPYRTP